MDLSIPITERPFNRRTLLSSLGVVLAGCGINKPGDGKLRAQRRMARFPEKADLVLLTDRPPLLETPLHYFRQDLTPNNAFFVRWHLEGIPTSVDLREFRLRVGGHVQRPAELSMEELRTKFEPVSFIALNKCSGNSRTLFTPQVPGGQWQHGAMGNARWTGVRLKDILDRVGVRAGAVDVTLNGLDGPPLSSVHDFVKSLDIDHARYGEVMVAYEMNGQALPMLNGFPLRLVVPGWYATYWVKALSDINVLPAKFDGFWMKKAYLIPNNPSGNEDPSHIAKDVIPINRFFVHSIFVRPEPGETLIAGRKYPMEGVASDAGAGIRRVEISTDGGNSWTDARLDPDLGRYSWRRWRFEWMPSSPGQYRVQVRATNAEGQTQPKEHWNHGGYMRQRIEEMDVQVV